MIIGILKENFDNETRVATTPESTKKFKTIGIDTIIESQAGQKSGFSDEEYINAGGQIAKTANEIITKADIILKINAPSDEEIKRLKADTTIIFGFQNQQTFNSKEKKLTCFALELVPRISRAQSIDVLSSQNNLAGYKAVIKALQYSLKSVPLMMTSAGTLTPAKFLILGLGVAGLQAAATAKRLGGMVYAHDIRTETSEQATSLGAKFIEKIDSELLSQTDIIICSAFSPKKEAPVLLEREQLQYLKKGSVIIDMAIEAGGNVWGSKSQQTITESGITIIGNSHLEKEIPYSASILFAQNLYNFISMYWKDQKLLFDFNDEIIKQTCILNNSKD